MIGLIFLVLCSYTISTAQSVLPAASNATTVVGQGAQDTGWVSIQTTPEGAEVYRDTVFCGITPLVRFPVEHGTTVFRLFYPGAKTWNAVLRMDSISVEAGEEIRRSVDMSVRPSLNILMTDVPSTESNPELFLAPAEKGNSRLLLGYAAGATMIISGVLSAYLKTKSDKDFDSYVVSHDPALLSSTQRLDKLAGASLFVTELSLGALMYLLLSE